MLLYSCSTEVRPYEEAWQDIQITISLGENSVRGADPDENLLSDLTVMIFDEDGYLEGRREFDRNHLFDSEKIIFSTPLLKGKKYSVYACANIGRKINAESFQKLMEERCHLVYPDEYREGIPMAGMAEGVYIDSSTDEIKVPLKRLMAKISLRIDRGGLSDDVRMDAVSVKVGNCPKSALMFRNSSVEDREDCFNVGFRRDESECSILNRNVGNGISGSVSLYMLENMQGAFSQEHIADDSDKTFDKQDKRSETCSYIEMHFDYRSPVQHSTSPLIYRFYLGSDRNNLDVERNCHYHITVIPEDDGLSDDGWRVDKSGLSSIDQETYFEMNPSGYLQANVGDIIHVSCRFKPEYAPFDIGIEELEFDKERGIYDYETDDDGHGVTLRLKSPGTGLLYMSAGPPINEAGMLVIEVQNIKNDIL